MTTARDGPPGAAHPQDAPDPTSGWHRAVWVGELGDADAVVRSWECAAFDLSRSGLTLRSRSMVHVGRTLEIRIPEAGAEQPRTLYGTVTDSTYQMGKGYILAIEFCAKPSRSEHHESGGD